MPGSRERQAALMVWSGADAPLYGGQVLAVKEDKETRKVRSELLLYGYGIVCLGMLVFNVIYNIGLKQNDRRLERRTRKMGERIGAQMERIRAGGRIAPGHIRYLRRSLSHVGSLIAFDHAMGEYPAGEGGVYDSYQSQIYPAILQLAVVYGKRNQMQSAYFAYFLSRQQRKKRIQADAVQGILVEYMKKESLYCRVNALQALYNFGSAKSVVEAVALLDGEGHYLHEKILTDGLLTFTGSHQELAGLLWERLWEFSERTQISVLNYIRFQTGEYCREMFSIMMDQEKDKELRLAAIRYFGRYDYPPAKEALLAFAADPDPMNWEYAAISAASLAKYQGEEVAGVLMNIMHSANWYVRYNAAASLGALGLDGQILIREAGEDRYAREMLMYRMKEQYGRRERATA